MKNLSDVEWGEFFIEEIADIVSGQDIYEAERTYGNSPYITSTAVNNGIGYYVGNNNKTLESNCLSVNRNGSVGYSFYHPYPALFSNDCRKLRLKKASKYVGIFISHQITQQKAKYGYGYKMGTGRLKRQKILLPVTSSGQPDYEFMESYMREIERSLIEKYRAYLTQSMPQLLNWGGGGKIFDWRNWGEFFIDEIFKITPGKRLTKSGMKRGKRPFIGASDSNNGITEFVSNENVSLDSNILGVNYNGSVVENFYHPYSCIFSDDVKRFRFRNIQGNKYLYLFMKQIILMQKKKYAYGYKFNEKRMLRQKILLPITQDGQPDYAYMESYMRQQECRCILRYLNLLENRSTNMKNDKTCRHGVPAGHLRSPQI